MATRLLVNAGADWIYKKVDSVLRGQVTAEVEAAMRQLKLQRALLLPANPSLGRIIRGGRYYVGGKPIHETEFARDPEHPRRSARVLELLSHPAMSPIHICRLSDPLPGSGIIVCEAATSRNLRRWVTERKPGMFAAGAAEFFAELLAARTKGSVSSLAIADELPAGERELFICGTSSKSAREFLRVARAKRTPVFSLPSELVWGADFTAPARDAIARRVGMAFKNHRRVVLNIGLPQMRGAAAARVLTLNLVQLAGAVLRQTDIGYVYAEGGATAAALVREMGWERLRVLRELAPGVARLGVDGNRSMLLTIKPGSYSWPSEVRRAPTSSRANV
jgi:uncharacterized protein YgbK (DUF1537 family)